MTIYQTKIIAIFAFLVNTLLQLILQSYLVGLTVPHFCPFENTLFLNELHQAYLTD